MHIETHLNFDGTCEEAFTFYAEALGGEIVFMLKHKDAPADAGLSPEWENLVMHACIKVGNATLLGADAPGAYYQTPQGFAASIQVETPEEAQTIWDRLSEGARFITMPIAETFWSPMFGMLTDRFGTPWMINTVTPDCG